VSILCGGLLPLLASGCQSPSEPALRVGFHWALGDPVSGADLAIREANSVGGIAGRMVATRVFFSNDDPSTDLPGLDGLIDERIVALIGPQTSATSFTIIDTLRSARVPAISPTATAPSLSGTAPPLDYFFRTAPSDAFEARLMAQRSIDSWGCTKSAILAQSDPFGQGLADAVSAYVSGRGMPIAVREDVDRFSTDFGPSLMRIADASPDCVFLLTFPIAGGTMINQWYDGSTRPSVIWIAPDSIRTAEFVDAVANTAFIDGVRGAAAAPAPTTFEYSLFARFFTSAYGRKPTSDEARRYDAAALLILALARTEGRGGDELRDALYFVATPPGALVPPGQLAIGLNTIARGGDVNYAGASGPVDFDASGDVVADLLLWRFDTAIGDFVDYEYVPASQIPPGP